MKSIGVKFKVIVTDSDWNNDDTIDGFVHLLQLTPALNVSIASWTQIVILGIRENHRTRLITLNLHLKPSLPRVVFLIIRTVYVYRMLL